MIEHASNGINHSKINKGINQGLVLNVSKVYTNKKYSSMVIFISHYHLPPNNIIHHHHFAAPYIETQWIVHNSLSPN